MLTAASRCPPKVMQEVAKVVCKHGDFLRENLPLCSNPAEVSKALAASNSWFVFVNGQSVAVFKLEVSGRIAIVSQFCVSDDSFQAVISGLRVELGAMKIVTLTSTVPPSEVERWTGLGFRRGFACAKFSRVPTQSNMMPLLPLLNPSQEHLLTLSQLMYAAYSKTDDGFVDVRAAEESLRAIMSGARGAYLQDASFVSGALPNLVSACLVTVDGPAEAKIVQLFTHPLYRARGLATIEIAAAMNRLCISGVTTLSAWIREDNEVVRRLLGNLGFKPEGALVEMSVAM